MLLTVFAFMLTECRYWRRLNDVDSGSVAILVAAALPQVWIWSESSLMMQGGDI